ncbi:sugar phosphate isomerase/epimerase [Oscillospiraceae bacterium HV4-5-C5C]|nr:sugar phosphate isomerase/epimerase [Oscillospiraceae bacterium HV4-5-C5C]
MLLTGPAFYEGKDPEAYALAIKQQGYKAGNCPYDLSSDDDHAIQALKESFYHQDLVFAEVGAWCNPLSPDPEEARHNQAYMVDRLKLADKLGAKTCVNVVGSKNTRYWAGPCPSGYTAAFAAEAASVMRDIIDRANPRHSCLSFEMMPYIFLDSAESYLDFLEAIDRPEQTGVHLDICNAINSPRRYYDNSAFIEHTISLLRPYIVSVHLKDIRLKEDCGTVQFEEVRPGTGYLDYGTLLQALSTLPRDTPAVLEHLDTLDDYRQAAAWVRQEALKLDLRL